MSTVGAYEAKTHLPRLLAEVEQGATVTITKHGRVVARLVPAEAEHDPPPQPRSRLEQLQEAGRLRRPLRDIATLPEAEPAPSGAPSASDVLSTMRDDERY